MCLCVVIYKDLDNNSLIARLVHYPAESGPYYYETETGGYGCAEVGSYPGEDFGGANWIDDGEWGTPDTCNTVCCNGNETVANLNAVMPAGYGFSTSTSVVMCLGGVIKKNMDNTNKVPSNDSGSIKLTSVFFQPYEISGGNLRTIPEWGSNYNSHQNNHWYNARNAFRVVVAYFG